MHDSKEGAGYDAEELLKQLGHISGNEDICNHHLYEAAFCALYQHEIEIVFDVSKDLKTAVPVEVVIGGETYTLSRKTMK